MTSADVPAVITLAPGGKGAAMPPTFDGYNMIDALKKLEEEGAACVGLNCARGPRTMIPLIRELRPHIKVRLLFRWSHIMLYRILDKK